jgi:hypothetical protein
MLHLMGTGSHAVFGANKFCTTAISAGIEAGG